MVSSMGYGCARELQIASKTGAQGALSVYSLTHRLSFTQVSSWPDVISNITVVLAGSKRPGEVSYCEGAHLAERLEVSFLEISALVVFNVDL